MNSTVSPSSEIDDNPVEMMSGFFVDTTFLIKGRSVFSNDAIL